jgi:hypothetical protein
MKLFMPLIVYAKIGSSVTSNILRWYQTELTNHDYDIAEYKVSTWNIINSSKLPSSVPRQRDGSSCSIFVAIIRINTGDCLIKIQIEMKLMLVL